MLPVIVLILALNVLSGTTQDRVPHSPLFPPEDLGILEGPDRDAWQMPDQVMDALIGKSPTGPQPCTAVSSFYVKKHIFEPVRWYYTNILSGY